MFAIKREDVAAVCAGLQINRLAFFRAMQFDELSLREVLSEPLFNKKRVWALKSAHKCMSSSEGAVDSRVHLTGHRTPCNSCRATSSQMGLEWLQLLLHSFQNTTHIKF